MRHSLDTDTFSISVHDPNSTVTPDAVLDEFFFFAFDHDDKYLESVTIENCVNCTLQPSFDPDIYSYYLIVPDDVFGLYFETVPSEHVHFAIDDPRRSLSEEEQREHQVTEMVMLKVGTFSNALSMKPEEVN